jgi:hypothetical protein
MNFLNIKAFLISFAIGLFYIYISNPSTKKITVFPTDDNQNKFQFRDKADNCASFKRVHHECSNNAIDIPVQK